MGSLSTPCCLVRNVVSRMPVGASLNNLLAKGINMVANLFHTLVNFCLGGGAITMDIFCKFYNQVKLGPELFQFKQILWPKDYLVDEEVGGGESDLEYEFMVFKTLIYRLRPSLHP